MDFIGISCLCGTCFDLLSGAILVFDLLWAETSRHVSNQETSVDPDHLWESRILLEFSCCTTHVLICYPVPYSSLTGFGLRPAAVSNNQETSVDPDFYLRVLRSSRLCIGYLSPRRLWIQGIFCSIFLAVVLDKAHYLRGYPVLGSSLTCLRL